MADAGGVSSQPLYEKYPISSSWEFTLKNGQSVKGEVYCTDPVADLVILQDSQNDIRMVSVSSIDAATRAQSTILTGSSACGENSSSFASRS